MTLCLSCSFQGTKNLFLILLYLKCHWAIHSKNFSLGLDVWLKMAEFLGRLNGESVSRESYVRTPEYEKALEAWKEKEQEWEDFLETLSAGQREKLEEIKECQEDFASAQELRAYMQGYVDCVQALYRMGLLKENEGLKWVEKMKLQ